MTAEFKRLMVFGDWDHYYLTMNRAVSGGHRPLARQVRRARPASTKARSRFTGASTAAPRWPKLRSSTSDHSSPSIYVEFPLSPDSAADLAARVPALAGRDVSVLIWTTTPWTIPSNLAIAFHPEFDYAAYDVDGRVVIVAEGLAGVGRRRTSSGRSATRWRA